MRSPTTRAKLLWRFDRGTNYVADVTSLDVLDIRGTGTRYDTMPETAPATITTSISRSGDGLQVLVRAQAIAGLRYQLEVSGPIGGAWSPLGAPVVANGDVVELKADLLSGAGGILPDCGECRGQLADRPLGGRTGRLESDSQGSGVRRARRWLAVQSAVILRLEPAGSAAFQAARWRDA